MVTSSNLKSAILVGFYVHPVLGVFMYQTGSFERHFRSPESGNYTGLLAKRSFPYHKKVWPKIAFGISFKKGSQRDQIAFP